MEQYSKNFFGDCLNEKKNLNQEMFCKKLSKIWMMAWVFWDLHYTKNEVLH